MGKIASGKLDFAISDLKKQARSIASQLERNKINEKQASARMVALEKKAEKLKDELMRDQGFRNAIIEERNKYVQKWSKEERASYQRLAEMLEGQTE